MVYRTSTWGRPDVPEEQQSLAFVSIVDPHVRAHIKALWEYVLTLQGQLIDTERRLTEAKCPACGKSHFS